VKLQIFSFIAKELSLLDNNAYFFGKPARGGPQHTMVMAGDCSVQQQNFRDIMDRLSGGYRLIALASTTPTLGGGLPLNATLKNLRESHPGHFGVASRRFLKEAGS
jgi:hypothetical protein